MSLGYEINKYQLSDKFKKKIISIKLKNEELAYSNNLPKYLSKSSSDIFVIMGAGDISEEVQMIKKHIELL